jgi:transposase-like protein
MKLHANAALSLKQRRRMVALVVEERATVAQAAARFEVCVATCLKWVKGF